MMSSITYSPLSSGVSYHLSASENEIRVNEDIFEYRSQSEHLTLIASEQSHESVMVAIEYYLGHHPEIKTIEVQGQNLPSQKMSRAEFFQVPTLWHHKEALEVFPEEMVETNGRKHPLRAAPHKGIVYKRYVPKIKKTISFRSVDSEKDLDLFHEWQNQGRVAHFWELNKPKEELKNYLEKGLQDPHQFPMIVEFDNEPVGYYEMYWVMEDRLGPYYECEAWDRGFHFLIGNTKYLGYTNTDSILNAGLHFLFLDDPRTKKVMAEPRSDNVRVIRYAEASKGWKILKEFDFPHKRAALLECSRDTFFEGDAL